MGWVSYLEDLKKKADDLDEIIDRIHRGEIAYVDENRLKVRDISRALRSQVANLEKTLRQLGPADQEIVEENLELKERASKLMAANQNLELDLKKAFETNAKLRGEREDEKSKHQFTIKMILDSDISEVRRYARKIRF
jgi:septal ring factor EnvC (AmiA/AmiB activator)